MVVHVDGEQDVELVDVDLGAKAPLLKGGLMMCMVFATQRVANCHKRHFACVLCHLVNEFIVGLGSSTCGKQVCIGTIILRGIACGLGLQQGTMGMIEGWGHACHT